MFDVVDEIVNVEELDKYKVNGDKLGEFLLVKM